MLTYEDAVQRLSIELDQPASAATEGVCRVRVAGVSFVLEDVPAQQGYTLRARLGGVAEARQAELLEQLMAGNRVGTGAGVLCLDEARDVYLVEHLPAAFVDVLTFGTILRAFLERAGAWQARLGGAA